MPCMNLSGYVGHVTTFRWMFTITCCSRVRVRSWLVSCYAHIVRQVVTVTDWCPSHFCLPQVVHESDAIPVSFYGRRSFTPVGKKHEEWGKFAASVGHAKEHATGAYLGICERGAVSDLPFLFPLPPLYLSLSALPYSAPYWGAL